MRYTKFIADPDDGRPVAVRVGVEVSSDATSRTLQYEDGTTETIPAFYLGEVTEPRVQGPIDLDQDVSVMYEIDGDRLVKEDARDPDPQPCSHAPGRAAVEVARKITGRVENGSVICQVVFTAYDCDCQDINYGDEVEVWYAGRDVGVYHGGIYADGVMLTDGTLIPV